MARAELEKTIAEALDGHLCRCTGYIKYHEAVRDVILADPGRYLDGEEYRARRQRKMKPRRDFTSWARVAALAMSGLTG